MLFNLSERAKSAKSKIGQLLMENGDVGVEQLAEALRLQKSSGGMLGRILQGMGACHADAVARAVRKQLQITELSRAIAAASCVREKVATPELHVRTHPRCTVALLMLADILMLASAAFASGSAQYLIACGSGPALYAQLWAFLCLFLGSFAIYHLYDCVALSPAEELRRTTLIITFVYSATSIGSSFLEANGLSKTVFLLGWLLSLGLVPLGRGVLRSLCAHRHWWGRPVIVLGGGKTGRMIVRTLLRQPGIGLKPVAVLDDDATKHGTIDPHSHHEKSGHSARRLCIQNIPVIGGLNLAPALAHRYRIPYGIVAMPSVPHDKLLKLLEEHGGTFSHLLIIPELFDYSSMHVPARDVGGVLGLEVRQQLLLPGPRLAKRIMDLVLTIIGGIAILPVLALIALLIKLDSKGSVFYIQERLGKDGRRFRAVKFRTMHGDGERRLKEVLDADPKLAEEYRIYHKLKNDPRVTRVGRLLRKYSLDEFPQLWNVLKGEMSLVGPRPYLEREIPEMNEREAIILKALPGMTGMWQVSVRNETAFSHRLKMDVYYVRNWCPWLDIYIFVRTAQVVARGTGS